MNDFKIKPMTEAYRPIEIEVRCATCNESLPTAKGGTIVTLETVKAHTERTGHAAGWWATPARIENLTPWLTEDADDAEA